MTETTERRAADGCVYLVVAPSDRGRAGWPKTRADIGRRVKGAPLAEFRDLFDDGTDYRRRWAKVARQLAGAVVVPQSGDGRLWIGPAALTEAKAVAEAGRPVLVHVPGGLVPWCRFQVLPVDGRGADGIAAELVLAGAS